MKVFVRWGVPHLYGFDNLWNHSNQVPGSLVFTKTQTYGRCCLTLMWTEEDGPCSPRTAFEPKWVSVKQHRVMLFVSPHFLRFRPALVCRNPSWTSNVPFNCLIRKEPWRQHGPHGVHGPVESMDSLHSMETICSNHWPWIPWFLCIPWFPCNPWMQSEQSE